jgi:tripartite ATP-independent transporter DctM subunit
MPIILSLGFLVTLIIGLDIGFSMIFSAFLGIGLKSGQSVDTVIVPLTMIGAVNVDTLVQIPLFILAGELMNRGGITTRLIDWSVAFVGHYKGSLGQVSLLTNLVLSGVSGSAVADAVAVGKPLIPAMIAKNYSPGYASAVVAAGALLGPIIPPSIVMVVYAQLASQSVVKMFMSGIIPGILMWGGFMVIATLTGRRRNYEAQPRVPMRLRLGASRRAFWALLMPVIIIGGIRIGLFTDTETAAVAACYALVIGLLVYRGLKFRELPAILAETGRGSAVILFLIAAAGPFSWLLAESQVNLAVIDLMKAITTDPLVSLIIINLVLLLVGTIIEPLPGLIIFVPVLFPVVAELGIDPIQFGALAVINLMIGMVTPPVGLLLFVVSNVGKVSMVPIVKEIVPFMLWAIFVLVLAIFVPGITTWLPSQV